MAVFLGVVAFKGGVGKTTLATCLGLGLSMFAGKRVLLVDFDPQANLTEALLTQMNFVEAIRLSELYSQPFSYEALLEGREPLVYPISGVDNLYIVPSNPKYMLWAAKRVIEPTQDKAQLFRATLGSIAQRHSIDYVVIDLPPQMYGLVVPIASVITDYIVTPVIRGSFSVDSVEYMIETYYSVARSYTTKPTVFLGAVLTKFGVRDTGVVRDVRLSVEKRIRNAFERLKKSGIVENVSYGGVFDTVIHYNVILTRLRNQFIGRTPYIIRSLKGAYRGVRVSKAVSLLESDIRSLAGELERRVREASST